jgi:hypothetical protein
MKLYDTGDRALTIAGYALVVFAFFYFGLHMVVA